MIITILSWLIILAIFVSVGAIIRQLIKAVFNYRIDDFSALVVMGIVGTTLYAETFSIFHRVRRMAFFILICICLIAFATVIIASLGKIRATVSKARIRVAEAVLIVTFVATSLLLASYFSAQTPTLYDTLNYHAQSIRWIEEYGIVKGLGNLHSRLAYNSSFLVLQALFSMTWAFGSPLHSLNGFIWVFFFTYCVLTFKCARIKVFYLSDALRVVFLLVLLRGDIITNIASPHTDFLPACLIAYIFIRWAEFNEEQIESYIPYGLLVLLGVFNISVKLSTAATFLFLAKPLLDMLKKRKYADILKFIGLGIIVILPFVVRNVIISGYLVYPVASIDLFNFDWEMPKSVALSDSAIIKAFARTWGDGYSIECMNEPFSKRFWEWIRKAPTEFISILSLTDAFVAVAAIITIIIKTFKGNYGLYDRLLLLTAIFGYIFLIVSAPSFRFGIIWFAILPIIYVYCLFNMEARPVDSDESAIAITILLLFICITSAIYISYRLRIEGENTDLAITLYPNGYNNTDAQKAYVEISGYKFYYCMPTTGEWGGLNSYEGVPGTECQGILNTIELRGATLADGFRVKKEYEDVPFSFGSWLISEDDIRTLRLDDIYGSYYK